MDFHYVVRAQKLCVAFADITGIVILYDIRQSEEYQKYKSVFCVNTFPYLQTSLRVNKF